VSAGISVRNVSSGIPPDGREFVESTLADGGDVDRVLLGVKDNDPERFAVEKTHLRAQLGEGYR
jgi:hypothetical protein